MAINQNEVFANGEGDAWYTRNQVYLEGRDAAATLDVQYICETLTPYQGTVNQVLEIGCSTGAKLAVICERLSAKGSGVDPSEQAIRAGNQQRKSDTINLVQGTGENLPFPDRSFDLVYFAFCLYLFDRGTLLKSLAEADRVLKPGGFLAITDFDPGSPRKRQYAHFQGMYSYKQDYASFFTNTGLYCLVGKQSFSHRQDHFDLDANERVATQILHKELDPLLTQD
jgi:ubiquinone/menaquinone biosynthesis C-methylase UbiE